MKKSVYLTKRLLTLVMTAIFVFFCAMPIQADAASNADGVNEESLFNMSYDSIIETVDLINSKYPEARINVMEAAEFVNEMSKLTREEQIKYCLELLNNGPEKTYTKQYADGSSKTLSVYAPMLVVESGAEPVTTFASRATTSYNGYKVYANTVGDLPGVNATFYVDVDVYSNGTKYIKNTYGFSGHGNGLFTVGGYTYVQRTGSNAIINVEIFDSGVLGAPTSYGKVRMTYTPFKSVVYRWIA